MQQLVLLISLICFAVGGYLWIDQPSVTATKQVPLYQTKEPIKSKSDQLAEQLINSPNQLLKLSNADHFVSADQLIQLPSSQETLELQTLSTHGTAYQISTVANPAKNHTQQGQLETSIRLKELLDDPSNRDGDLFYLHAVKEDDQFGIWGILHNGLIRTFADGIQLEADGRIKRATIPSDSDEKLRNQRSSFLGSILFDKVQQTYVYNYQKGMLGENPDLIKPGQQLIVASFSRSELLQIYEYFREE